MDQGTATMLAGAIGAVGNVASNVYSGRVNEKVAGRQNEWNLAMYQRQLADSRENWNMQNAYNSPKAQMERLKEAGLNPNLVYGNSTSGSAGNAGSMSSTPSAQPAVGYYRPMNMMAGLGDLAQLFLTASTVRRNNSETDSIRERTLLTREQALTEQVRRDGMNWANAKTKEEAAIWKRKLHLDMGMMQDQMRKFRQDVLQSKETTRGAKLRNDNYQMWNNSMSAMEYANLADRHELNLQELALFEFKKQNLIARTQQSIASALLMNSNNIDLNDQRASQVAFDIINSAEGLYGKQLENKITEVLIDHGINLKEGGKVGILQKLKYLKQGTKVRPRRYFDYGTPFDGN